VDDGEGNRVAGLKAEKGEEDEEDGYFHFHFVFLAFYG
jgi:hypothetical protein